MRQQNSHKAFVVMQRDCDFYYIYTIRPAKRWWSDMTVKKNYFQHSTHSPQRSREKLLSASGGHVKIVTRAFKSTDWIWTFDATFDHLEEIHLTWSVSQMSTPNLPDKQKSSNTWLRDNEITNLSFWTCTQHNSGQWWNSGGHISSVVQHWGKSQSFIASGMSLDLSRPEMCVVLPGSICWACPKSSVSPFVHSQDPACFCCGDFQNKCLNVFGLIIWV